jgi:hypothetical protein
MPSEFSTYAIPPELFSYRLRGNVASRTRSKFSDENRIDGCGSRNPANNYSGAIEKN